MRFLNKGLTLIGLLLLAGTSQASLLCSDGAYAGSLDVSDVTYDGRPAELGRGNAEIKELISILRSSGFDGYMVLGVDNRLVGDLRATVARFSHLLDTI